MTRLSKASLAGVCLAFAASAALFQSRTDAQSQTAPPSPKPDDAPKDWIQGATDEKFRLVSKHLRGFDMTMAETGYRYSELYWAGQDQNWDYAAYQLDKIRHTIELGIERRPKRAPSAKVFLTTAVPSLKHAIENKDAAQFDSRFKLLTATCNTCHAMEKMPFVQIHPPDQRHSPVQFQKK